MKLGLVEFEIQPDCLITVPRNKMHSLIFTERSYIPKYNFFLHFLGLSLIKLFNVRA